jgi:3-deoxy-D-manno-octulosonic-acid transferase
MAHVADRLPLTLVAYQLLTAAGTPFAPRLIKWRLRRDKEHAARFTERYGESRIARPDGPLIWLHGASVGELLSVVPLIERIRERQFAVLVTSGTVTSARLAEQRLPPGVVHQFVPLDAPRFVTRFLDHWRPDLGLFIESDLWPCRIIAAHERGLPMILLNARLSERSYNRWRHLPGTVTALLNRFDLCLPQSRADAERFAELGAPRISTTGNLKLDIPEAPASAIKFDALRTAIGKRPVIAAASTHAGEEAIVIDAHRRLRHSFPGLLTMIAPRHPERGPGVIDIATAGGLKAAQRSRGEMPDAGTDVYILDTLGELGLVYRLAPIVFVGGSLVKHGGQNPIESIKLGGAILHGPHVWNFSEIYEALDAEGGAVEITDGGKLTVRIGAWLTDEQERKKVVGAAARTVERLGGALGRTLTALEPYLMQLQLEHRSGRGSDNRSGESIGSPPRRNARAAQAQKGPPDA